MPTKMQWLWIALCGVILLSMAIVSEFPTSPAQAYSAAQAEAQSDPYSYPNVELCCKPKPPPRPPLCERNPDAPSCVCKRNPKKCTGSGTGRGNGNGEPAPDEMTVDCGASPDSEDVIHYLQDAVDAVAPGGKIVVRSGFPGGDCREHVRIEKDVTIEGEEINGRRWPVIVNGCVTITGPHRPHVILRGVQILGTTTGLNGRTCRRARAVYTGFDGEIHNQQIQGIYNVSALSVAGGTLEGENVVVRSAARALDAEHSIVELRGGSLAANPDADIAVSLDGAEARFSDVAVAGGKTGISARMTDRHGMEFENVRILRARTQQGSQSAGEIGLDVWMFDEGLPGLPSDGIAGLTWRNGEIRPFKQGIVLNSGVSARISDVTVSDAHVGIRVEPGAVATLDGNRIERSSGIGIKLQRGAAGRAQSNKVTCVSGECLCYGDDCDDDEEDIDSGGFKLSGNSCRRDRRGRFF